MGEPIEGKDRTQKDNDDVVLDVWDQVDGFFYDSVTDIRQFEEYGCIAVADAQGESSVGQPHHAAEFDTVAPMPARRNPDFPEPEPDPDPPLGISPIDPNATLSPGESYEVRLVTEVPFYFVDWYVKTPWDTSERGTHEEYDPGDGTLTEATFRYTFPSGAMHTGDFLITAVYYLWSSDTSEYEETYTVTVSLD